MRILLVEDDPHVAAFILKGLREDGHAVDHAADGRQGLFLATTEPYEAIVLDRMLPGLDGMTVLQTLRGAGNRAPILLLTALGEVDHRVEGLRAGADDYLVKPFAYAELSARLDGIVRRGRGVEREPTRLRVADLELDQSRHRAFRGKQRIDLTTKEFALLHLLMRQSGVVLSRTQIISFVWDMNFDCDTNVVEVSIRRLRAKIDDPFERKLIHTLRGVGYVLEERD